MRYLKTIIEFSTEKNYKEIDVNIYNDKKFFEGEKFSQSEISLIANNLKKEFIIKKPKNEEYEANIGYKYGFYRSKGPIDIIDIKGNAKFCLSKFLDEWYLIYDFKNSNLYECDQLDSVLEFLKDNEIAKDGNFLKIRNKFK